MRRTHTAGVACAVAILECAAVVAAQPAPGAEQPAEPVVIVDLRAPADNTTPADAARARLDESRRGLARALGEHAAITFTYTADSELERALAGQLRSPGELERAAANAVLERAAAAFGQLDCSTAEAAAGEAVLAFAAMHAAGRSTAQAAHPSTGNALKQAYIYRLLCAHGRGESDAAIAARTRLELLGVSRAPAGVNSMVWGLYPALDATSNSQVFELELTTTPPDAEISVDHQYVGRAPVKVFVPEGTHLIAAASGSRHTALEVAVASDGQAVHLDVPAAATESRYLALSKRVESWRENGYTPTPEDIAALLTLLEVRFGLVLGNTREAAEPVEIWALGPGEREARLLGVTPASRVADIAGVIARRARAWDRTGPDPNIELLREPANVRTDRKKAKKLEWWAYATIIGAVAAGTAVILANDLADDRQRIELTWP